MHIGMVMLLPKQKLKKAKVTNWSTKMPESRGRDTVKLTLQNVSKTHTANASKLIEKCFLDLRNIFLNQESIRKFFSKQEDLSSQEKFSRPFHKKVYLNLRKWSRNKNSFLETRNIFSLRQIFLI